MEDDDALYSKLFGEEAPAEQAVNRVSSRGVEQDEPNDLLSAQSFLEKEGFSDRAPIEPSAGEPHSSQKQADTTPAEEFRDFADAQKEFDDDDDGDFDVKLDEPEPVEDDELELKLDETDEAQAPLKTTPKENTAHKFVRSGVTAARAGSQPGNETNEGAAPNHAARPASGNPVRPFSYPEYDPSDPGLLPSQVKGPGQRIRLPGQTKVKPEEYREFLGLGHGDIFNLDIDWVVDAPWRAPGIDQSEFFNYGLNSRTWKEYCAKIKQFQSEMTMQRNIQVYDNDYKPSWGAGRKGYRGGRGTNSIHQPERLALGWKEQQNGGLAQPSERLALPPPASQRDGKAGAAEGGDMPLLPMPGMGQLPMPPLAGQTWDREEGGQAGEFLSNKRRRWDAG